MSDGPPPVGAKVWVKWTDGDLYGATFRGTKDHCMYTVSTHYCMTFHYIIVIKLMISSAITVLVLPDGLKSAKSSVNKEEMVI